MQAFLLQNGELHAQDGEFVAFLSPNGQHLVTMNGAVLKKRVALSAQEPARTLLAIRNRFFAKPFLDVAILSDSQKSACTHIYPAVRSIKFAFDSPIRRGNACASIDSICGNASVAVFTEIGLIRTRILMEIHNNLYMPIDQLFFYDADLSFAENELPAWLDFPMRLMAHNCADIAQQSLEHAALPYKQKDGCVLIPFPHSRPQIESPLFFPRMFSFDSVNKHNLSIFFSKDGFVFRIFPNGEISGLWRIQGDENYENMVAFKTTLGLKYLEIVTILAGEQTEADPRTVTLDNLVIDELILDNGLRFPVRKVYGHLQFLHHFQQRQEMDRQQLADEPAKKTHGSTPAISSRIIRKTVLPDYATLIAYADERVQFIHEHNRVIITYLPWTERCHILMESGEDAEIRVLSEDGRIHVGEAFTLYARYIRDLLKFKQWVFETDENKQAQILDEWNRSIKELEKIRIENKLFLLKSGSSRNHAFSTQNLGDSRTQISDSSLLSAHSNRVDVESIMRRTREYIKNQ